MGSGRWRVAPRGHRRRRSGGLPRPASPRVTNRILPRWTAPGHRRPLGGPHRTLQVLHKTKRWKFKIRVQECFEPQVAHPQEKWANSETETRKCKCHSQGPQVTCASTFNVGQASTRVRVRVRVIWEKSEEDCWGVSSRGTSICIQNETQNTVAATGARHLAEKHERQFLFRFIKTGGPSLAGPVADTTEERPSGRVARESLPTALRASAISIAESVALMTAGNPFGIRDSQRNDNDKNQNGEGRTVGLL